LTAATRAYPELPTKARFFMWAVVVGVFLAFGLTFFRQRHELIWPDLAIWVAVVAAVELLPVPVSKVLHFSLGFPILLGVAILYHPGFAAIVALIGSSDPRELKREIPITKALYNRSQIAVSTLAESAAFHALASVNSRLYVLLPAAFLAAAIDYLINVSLVLVATRLIHGLPFRRLLAQFKVGALSEFLFSYLGLGFVGVIIAELYNTVHLWGLAAFILPVVFARQMFFRNLALEEASKELKDRERVMRALSNRMAEERQDERMQIAAYLHDDLAQMLFRLTLQVEMAKKRLVQGESDAVLKDLDGISVTKQETSDAIRALIRDLHRSPIGRKGLAEAIQSFAEDVSRGHPTRVETDVIEVSLPPPIQLLIYQISREATMNALKHAEASTIRISLEEIEDGVKLQIVDDGKGFDTSASPPEGHFGSVMMRERAMVAGGTYSIDSEIGVGTNIAVMFPRVWLEEGSRFEADAGLGEESGRPPSTTRPPVGSTVGPPRGSGQSDDGRASGRKRNDGTGAGDSEPQGQEPANGAVPAASGRREGSRTLDSQTAWPDREPAVPA
jgi:signal transduction histidine kinase